MVFIFVLILLLILKTFSFKKLHQGEYYTPRHKTNIQDSISDTFLFCFSILVQQMGLLILWLTLKLFNIAPEHSIFILAVVFTLVHTQLLFKFKRTDSFILIVSSFFGGLIFGTILQNYYYGIFINFLIHLSYHIVLDFVFIFLKRPPIKSTKK